MFVPRNLTMTVFDEMNIWRESLLFVQCLTAHPFDANMGFTVLLWLINLLPLTFFNHWMVTETHEIIYQYSNMFFSLRCRRILHQTSF